MLPATAQTPPAGADSPFRPGNQATYGRWRDRKLAARPASIAERIVEVRDPRRLSEAERGALVAQCRDTNMALYALADAATGDRDSVKKLAEQLDLRTLDSNMLAETDGLTEIRVNSSNSNRGYIPYTSRRLLWHTDGYYNTPERTIRGMLLHCVQSGANGGENGLIDPEIVYILLRERDPSLVEALMQPNAMIVPANEESPEAGRGEQAGPVFSIDPAGNLHMRYTHRTRSIRWADEALAARDALVEILDGPAGEGYVYRVTLEPGQGIVCNNILHNRTAFEDDPRAGRLLYRGRYYERVAGSDTAAFLSGS